MHKVLRRRCAKIQHSAPFVSVKRAYILNSDANLLTYTLNALLPHIFIYLQLTRSHLSKSLPYHLTTYRLIFSSTYTLTNSHLSTSLPYYLTTYHLIFSSTYTLTNSHLSKSLPYYLTTYYLLPYSFTTLKS